MNKKFLTIVLAGVAFTLAPLPALAKAGNGRLGGQGLHKQNKTTMLQGRQQIHDGSCLTSGTSGAGTAQQKGNTYGPGDGTGNQDIGPQDGTGYGDPANK